jgi:hypothetical protein
MDDEMYYREGGEEKIQEIILRNPDIVNIKNINYRLIQEWEVPAWIKIKPVDKDEEEMDLINLGKRQRTNLYNTDNLTEA